MPNRALFGFTATILNGASLSDAVELNNLHLVTIIPPAGWTAANLAIDGSADGLGGWMQMGDQYGALFSFPVTVGRSIQLPPALGITSWRFIRFRSVTPGDATVAAPQGADRAVTGFHKRYVS